MNLPSDKTVYLLRWAPDGEGDLALVADAANSYILMRRGTGDDDWALVFPAVTASKITGAAGPSGPDQTWQILTANATPNSSTTYVPVMVTTGLEPGWYQYEYFVVVQSGAATTGVKLRVFFAGTAGQGGTLAEWPSTGTTDTNNVLASGAGSTGARMLQHFEAVASGGDLGPMTDVQTANADAFIKLTGYLEVTDTGDLVLDHASEVAAASTVQAGTWLCLRKVS